MFAIANQSRSGFRFRSALEAVASVLVSEGHHKSVGAAFCDSNGGVLPRWLLNEIFVVEGAISWGGYQNRGEIFDS